jgi:16S rRNA C967 or C1407 C5-methylase (RsmB/RsmF family)
MCCQAFKALKPGGRLVFSTCTINPDENERNTAWAQRELGLKVVDASHVLREQMSGAYSSSSSSSSTHKSNTQAIPSSIGAPGVTGEAERGGLAASEACKVLRFNPGQLCQGLIELNSSEEGGVAAGLAMGQARGGWEVDMFPGFYIACFEKEA